MTEFRDSLHSRRAFLRFLAGSPLSLPNPGFWVATAAPSDTVRRSLNRGTGAGEAVQHRAIRLNGRKARAAARRPSRRPGRWCRVCASMSKAVYHG